MSAEDAITRLLGRRTALMAVDPLRWDRGLVLAELGDAALVQPLLRRWKAVSLEPVGVVARYRLPTGLLLAHRTDAPTGLLLFGPDSDDDGLWSRAVLLMAGRGGPSLANNALFRELSEGLPAEFDGLFCLAGAQLARILPVRRNSGDNSMLVATMDVSAGELAIEVRARPCEIEAAPAPSTQSVTSAVPADTLAVWSGRLNLPDLFASPASTQSAEAGDSWAVVRRAFAQLGALGIDVIRPLLGRATLVLGRTTSESPDEFEQPTLTLLVETRQSVEASKAMDALVLLLWNWLAEQSPATDPNDTPFVTSSQPGELEIRKVPIGSLLARRTRCPFFERLELSWTAADNRFVVSSSRVQLERVIDAIRGRGPRLSDNASLASKVTQPSSDADWLIVRGAPLAAMLRSWLDYVERNRPEALAPAFWSRWAVQRLEQHRRLGVGLRTLADRPHEAEVVEIIPDTPAARYLRLGDIVVNAAGRPLATTQPAREVAERFRADSTERAFTLGIRRGGSIQTITIPLDPISMPELEHFDPVAGVRMLIAIAEHIDSVTLRRRAGTSDLFDATAVVRWKPGAR